MPKKTWFELIKLIGFFALIWILFMLWNPSFFSEDLPTISIENEERLGILILDDLFENPGFARIENQELDSMMHLVEARLFKNLEPTEYEIQIIIVDNAQVNAFTLPGGNIIVFSGLIKFTESAEELAAVLSHEFGHVLNRHVISKLMREFGLAILTSVLTGGNQSMINEIAGTLISSSFDRQQEAEADQYALQHMERSQINPLAIASLFRRMNRENLGYNQSLEMLMSHPHNNARIKAALEYKVAPDFQEDPFKIDWEKVRSLL